MSFLNDILKVKTIVILTMAVNHFWKRAEKAALIYDNNAENDANKNEMSQQKFKDQLSFFTL